MQPWNNRTYKSELRADGKLGEGSFGIVYKAYSHSEKCHVAIKAISRKLRQGNTSSYTDDSVMPSISVAKLRKEIKILLGLTHPNVIRYYHSWLEEKFLFIKMEYCETTYKSYFSLDFWNQENRIENQVFIQRHILKQILTGLQYIHEKNIIHRDIKPDNILLQGFQEKQILEIGNVKICDFGLAELTENSLSSNVGTRTYRSPEMSTADYTGKTDIYSTGLVFYKTIYLFASRPATIQAFQEILGGSHNFPKILEEKCGFSLQILQEMTSSSADQRPSAVELCEWITEGCVPDPSSSPIILPEKNFVGRHAQLEQLHNLVKKVSATNHIYIAVPGSSGIGKSSLCTQFLAALTTATTTSTAYCFEVDGSNWNTLNTNLFAKHCITVPVKRSQISSHFLDAELIVIYIDNLFGSFIPTAKLAPLDDNGVRKVRIALFNHDSIETDLDSDSTDTEGDTHPLIRRDTLIEIPQYDHEEDKAKVRVFLESLSDVLRKLQKKLVVVVSCEEEDPFTARFEHFNLPLEEFDVPEAEFLVKKLFVINDAKQISNLVSRLGQFPLFISRAAVFHKANSVYGTIPQFLEANIIEITEKISIEQVQRYKKGVVPMSRIYKELDNVAILMLAMLAFFPPRYISAEICTLVMEKLLKQSPTAGPSTRSTNPVENLIMSSRGMLKKFGFLKLLAEGSPHLLSTHQIYQRRTFSSLRPFHKPFSLRMLAALQELINENEINPEIITERKSKDDLINVASTVWDNCKDLCNPHQFLTIPKFLDDKSPEVYSNKRFKFLEFVTQGVINIDLDHSNIDREEFNCLASRYLYTSIYSYMNYTSGITDILKKREKFADFKVETKLNNLHYTGKIYIIFNICIFLLMSCMIAGPFTFWWYSNRSWFELWWYDIFGVAMLVVLAVFVPLLKIHALLIYSNIWIRRLVQWSTIAAYLVTFGIYKVAEYYRFRIKGNEQHVSKILIGIIEQDMTMSTIIIFCIIGAVT
ncbi:Cell division protein kinase 2, partial [Folsomia candida]